MDALLLALEVCLLIGFAAVCSGLKVAFMSLNIDDLRRKSKLGSVDARRVLPLRKDSHQTLAAILLSNAAAASASPLVLHAQLNGVLAGALSTLLLVTFGEIMPQALFTRRALRYCALLSPLLRLMVLITYPVAKPLQLLLDRLFGDEKSELHTRHELGLIMTEHLGDHNSELDEDEVEIIRGALQLSEKRVRDIITEIGRVYWLTPDTVIDGHKIDEIKVMGRSRIPVFDQHLTKSYGVLLMKDLVDINFDDEPQQVDDLTLHPSQIVGNMTALDTLFRKFIAAGTHLLPVERDDKIVGIVTIEDLLEEIVGHEIVDETDRQLRRG